MNKNEAIDRVSDAPSGNWVYSLLPRKLWPYAQLARWDRPIGWWLLLWPCWWSLTQAFISVQFQVENGLMALDASNGFVINFANIPLILGIFLAFLMGAVFMRGAGCTYNDLVDADLDASVARTISRPIPSGRVSKASARLFLIAQLLAGFVILMLLCWFFSPDNQFAFFLGIASLIIVALYPFAKRVTDWPQFVLGLAFSWGALMGWAVVFGSLSVAPVALYMGSILWTIGYDTIYAHQDREDDALVGVRSTARLFGEKTKPALILLYSGTLLLFAVAFFLAHAGWLSILGLAVGCGQMIWQINHLNIDDADNCLALFQSNSWFGWIVFGGLILDLFV